LRPVLPPRPVWQPLNLEFRHALVAGLAFCGGNSVFLVFRVPWDRTACFAGLLPFRKQPNVARKTLMVDKMLNLLACRPDKEMTVTLSVQAIEQFWEQGFTCVDRITTDEEIAWLREVYDLMFSGEVELPAGRRVYDVTNPLEDQRGQLNSQVLFPEAAYPQLRETQFYRNSHLMARQLFGVGEDLGCWGHMARKAPRNPEVVPWHQDEAYWDPTYDHEGAAFWMPLDPATVESGAMSFIPGSHNGDVFKHGYPDDNPSFTALTLKESVDTTAAVPQPVLIGGVSIHHNRTLHWSGPNQTDNPRRAYVNVWSRTPVLRHEPHDRPWYWRKMEWFESRKSSQA
jgi:hypothetical protein